MVKTDFNAAGVLLLPLAFNSVISKSCIIVYLIPKLLSTFMTTYIVGFPEQFTTVVLLNTSNSNNPSWTSFSPIRRRATTSVSPSTRIT
ncbi:hypothetical protein D3C73_1537560 [compost metagenome]